MRLSLGRDLAKGLLHLVYPPICGICRRPTEADEPFCASCQESLTKASGDVCPRCASGVGPHAVWDGRCARCRDRTYHFERAIRFGVHEGWLRGLILQMKGDPTGVTAELLGALWVRRDEKALRGLGADLVIPIPLHWRRRLSRGYNQSAILAEHVARRLDRPCQETWLRRTRNTPQQTTQTEASRWDNVRGAFSAKPRPGLKGRRVLLIDDVLTTGSTCSEAARALRLAGAARVVVAVLAHARA